MSFTVSQLLVAALRNPAFITSETAAYMVLSLAEQSQSGPRRVNAEHVLLHPAGAITIGDVPPCSAGENDALLRDLLGRLLACTSQHTISEALARVVQGAPQGPATLRGELQTALVPLNRGAARRALSRLYRKLGAALEVLAENSRQHQGSRLPRREKPPTETLASEEIPVVVDETAFRVVSKEACISALPVAPGNDLSADWVTVSWHPAQTTPRLFHDGATGNEQGTPLLGSLRVRERGGLPEDPASTASAESSTSVPEFAADVSLESTQVSDDAIVERLEPPDEWSDTVVDTLVAATPCRNDDSKRISRRSIRRSAVNHLVQRLPERKREMDQARESLLEIVNHVADDSDFSHGSATPPPVARETPRSPLDTARRGPKRIVLTALAIGAAFLGIWVLRPTEQATQRHVASASGGHPCEVRVHVEVPAEARVFLNDSRDRPAQRGPLASFDGVVCGGQAEVTVQVPSPSGSPLPDAWVRMPLPEAELRSAARSGRPLRVSPLGENR